MRTKAEFVLSVTEKNLNLHRDQYKLLMLLPINSPCNLWSIVFVEEADVEDLRGVNLMLFWLMLGRSSPRRSIIPLGELHTSPDPLTVREYMSSVCTVHRKVRKHFAEYQISPDRSIRLLHKEGLCTCLHVFVYVSVATWIHLEVLAVFYVYLLAGVTGLWFLCLCVCLAMHVNWRHAHYSERGDGAGRR